MKKVPSMLLVSMWYGDGNWNFSSCRKKISCGLFPYTNAFPASVNSMCGDRSTKPKAFGALFILSLALKSLFFDEPLPSKNPDCANRSINAICVCLFHFCPEKCSLSNCISGIILDGVRGDVVKNKALFFRYAMCSPPGLIILYDNVHFIVVKTIFDIYGVVLIILVENIISI